MIAPILRARQQVTNFMHIRRQQILREAEGYLDLAMACSDELPLSEPVRNRLAQRALSALAQVERNRSNKSHWNYLQGQALRVMERFPEAIEYFESAAELDSKNVHIWLALGWCHKRTGKLDMAIQSLEEALAFEPGEAIIYYNLACYWSLANNVKLALEYLSRAFSIDPDYRELIGGEHDFDPIRADPRFQELTSVIV